jgi:hypothetical protein
MDKVPDINLGHIYVVGGKEWIVGEQKISMFSKAKCNKKEGDKTKPKPKKKKEEKIEK